jgi:hypothetical protein
MPNPNGQRSQSDNILGDKNEKYCPFLVQILLLSVLLSSCQNAPKPSETVVPPDGTTVPADGTAALTDGEKTDPPTDFKAAVWF